MRAQGADIETDASAPLLAIDGLSKAFGGTQALDAVSLEVRAGEVHGLVGQNGSGKSTLIKILSGYHQPDGGEVRIEGRRVDVPLPLRELRRLGLEFVHQDLGLVPTMSVLENLRLGRFETGRMRRIHWRSERRRTVELLRRFEVDADPDLPVERLSQAERAIVAIMRALADLEEHHGRGLLVLDEPTAALPAHEIEQLFEAIRRVAEGGSGVLIVTHNLDEVFEITDRVSVLRDGRLVADRRTADLNEDELVELIVGQALTAAYPTGGAPTSEAALRAIDLTGRTVRGVSFEARKGEILGLTGLVGAGHDELPYRLYGALPARGGVIEVGGRPLTDPSPQSAKDVGVVLLPGDRQQQSAILGATVKENVTLPSLELFSGRLGRLRHGRERTAVQQVLDRFQVRPPDPDRRMLTLSGGNQQKALIGRCLQLQPDVLVLHEPTQGVDVVARHGIFAILRRAADEGTAIVYASVEYEDLANVCDRVLVFRRGRVVAQLEGGALTKEAIVAHCYQTNGGGDDC
jgi:ribose transport system ATP-binding protein